MLQEKVVTRSRPVVSCWTTWDLLRLGAETGNPNERMRLNHPIFNRDWSNWLLHNRQHQTLLQQAATEKQNC